MSPNPDIGKLFLTRLNKIYKMDSLKERNVNLFNLYNIVFEECTNFENMDFNTLFSRMAFASIKFDLSSKVLHQLHIYRRDNERDKLMNEDQIYDGSVSLALAIEKIYQCSAHENLSFELVFKSKEQQSQKIGFKRFLSGLLIDLDVHSHSFSFLSDDEGQKQWTVLYNVTGKNEIYTDIINKLPLHFKFPVHLNLLDVQEQENDVLVPNAFIIEPNYLVDVTAIAEVHKSPDAVQSLLYLIKKFIPVKQSKGLLLGNISNYLLDEIITDPDFNIKDRLIDIFKMYPLAFANQSDFFVQEVVRDIYQHYTNLKKAVTQEFPKLGIEREKLNIEPSFYDINHGIQGRLDVLQENSEVAKMDIIELKSGSIFRPNVYGLNNNHYTQTLLYDLIINSVYPKKFKTSNYILYSKESDRTLRFAPSVRSQQIEALTTRNRILLMEMVLARCTEEKQDLFEFIRPENFPKSMGFEKENIKTFKDTYGNAEKLSQEYFKNYVAFIAKEHRFAKIGKHGINADNGLASLWLENLDQKEMRFSILKELKIQENQSQEKEPILVLSRSKYTNELANFRKGDIAVLYPSVSSKSPLEDQVFKCNIIDINNQEIKVRLRSKQSNQSIFEKNTFWNVEADHLDSSFNAMYRSLFAFLQAQKKWQELWLCQRPPTNPNSVEAESVEVPALNIENLTSQQNQVLTEMLKTQDYYLLWGPPGTGKTSVILKNFVDQAFNGSKQTLLLLAYTNRAVDEICEAIESISPVFKDHYIRIGSKYSTGEAYRKNLLQNGIADFESRSKVRSFIESKRIVVGTLSSMASKSALFELIKIDTVVIDEASQILDPQLAGFLSQFKRFILIGDHKQLPAVVRQDGSSTKVDQEALNELGIRDLKDSLFERLYKQCEFNKWDWAIGVVEAQGRMHESLMNFPNQQFYNGQLSTIPSITRLSSLFDANNSPFESRMVFFDSPPSEDLNIKTNIHEAAIVVDVLSRLLEQNDDRKQSIGVITPYRAQIAQIKKIIEQRALDCDGVSIDTVERYQGSSRDIIIISFCVNQIHQLQTLVSLSAEGVDRKLNVALTRAKEQIILVGNKELLVENPVYKELISRYQEMPLF